MSIGVSAGIAMAPADGVSGDDLLKFADTAMYATKAARGTSRFYAGPAPQAGQTPDLARVA